MARRRADVAEERPDQAPLTIISVMRLTTVKRAVPLVSMLHAVREAVPAQVPMRALIIGDGPKRAAVGRRLHRHGLTDVVTLAGTLDRGAIKEELHRAAVFLAPAERESFGIAPLEARTAGLPIVASSRSGVGEFVDGGVHGLLGDDDEAMVTHLVRLLTDDRLRHRIARHNRLVPPEHDWPAALTGAARLYDLARAEQLTGPSR